MGFRNRTVKTAVCILLASMSLMLFGCSIVMHAVDREVFGPSAVNDFIDLTDKDLDEITELVCDPGEDACISGSNYDKLGKLENLESLDISYSKIEDVSFVIDLPQLKEFVYRNHSTCDANVDILKQHPNYDESWIND